jgi:hypothetical protein
MTRFAARVSLGLCAFWDYLEHMTRLANDPTVLVKIARPAFANPGDIDTHDAFFEVVGDVNETRLRTALTANLEFRIWNDARVGDAVVQVRASGACALARIRSMLESADLVVLGGRCARVA